MVKTKLLLESQWTNRVSTWQSKRHSKWRQSKVFSMGLRSGRLWCGLRRCQWCNTYRWCHQQRVLERYLWRVPLTYLSSATSKAVNTLATDAATGLMSHAGVLLQVVARNAIATCTSMKSNRPSVVRNNSLWLLCTSAAQTAAKI